MLQKKSFSIRKIWLSSFELILSKPIIILPFFIIAFFEFLTLELLYFSTRKPLSTIAIPIIKKYFGESSIYYPNNLLILPKLFYYAQIIILIFIGVSMIAVSINIFKNIKMNLPIKLTALIKNTSKRYMSFVLFGIILTFSLIVMEEFDLFIFSKFARLSLKFFPFIGNKFYFIGLLSFFFLSSCILHTFLISTIPLMVIYKKSLLRAMGQSIFFGFRNFLSIFTLIFMPFLLYFPITILKSALSKLVDKTFPEISLYVTGIGIIIAVLIDCFIFVCVSQFLLDKEPLKK